MHGLCALERIHQPKGEGQRTGALRFGDQRTMALAGTQSCIHAVTGFTNKRSRAGGRTPRYGLQLGPDELRPATTTPPWPHGAPRRNQHLHHHQRGHPRRKLLYQLKNRLLAPFLEANDIPRRSRSVGPSPSTTTTSTTTLSARLGTPAWNWSQDPEVGTPIRTRRPYPDNSKTVRSRTATLTRHSSRAIDLSNYSHAHHHPRIRALVRHSLISSSQICLQSYLC